MYTQFQRFVATLLLFSILLQSCGNPNWKMVEPADAGSSGETSKPKRLAPLQPIKKQENANEGTMKVGSAPTIAPSSEASVEVARKSFYAPSRTIHGGGRSGTVAPTAVRSLVVPPSKVAQASRPSSVLKKPPTHGASKPQRAVPDKAPASPHALHSNQLVGATPPPTVVKPADRTTPLSRSLQRAAHPLQTATKSSVASQQTPTHAAPKTQLYPSAQGHQVCLQEEKGVWQAQVTNVWGCTQKLPVVCASDQAPEQAIQQLASKATGQQKYRIHVLETDQPPWAPRVVYVGALGLRGGGNSSSSSRCAYPGWIYGGDNSDGEPDGEVRSGGYRFYRSNTNNWCVELQRGVSGEIVSGGVIRADRSMSLSANDIRALGDWHRHDCQAGWGDCFVPGNHSHAFIIAQRDRRQEERRRRRQEAARRQDEQRRRQEEARRQEEERRRQEEEKAAAKRKADGRALAEQVGKQAAAKRKAAGFKKFWNESPAIQKQQAQMRRSMQALYTPQKMGQEVTQERIGFPTSEALDAIDNDEDASVAIPWSCAVPHQQSELTVLEAHETQAQDPTSPLSSAEAFLQQLQQRQAHARHCDAQERGQQKDVQLLLRKASGDLNAWKDWAAEDLLTASAQQHLDALHEKLLVLTDKLAVWEKYLRAWGEALDDWANSLHPPADASWNVDLDLGDYHDMLEHYQKAQETRRHTQDEYQVLLQGVATAFNTPQYHTALTTLQLQRQAKALAHTLVQIANKAAVATEQTLQQVEQDYQKAKKHDEKVRDQLENARKKWVRKQVVVMAHTLNHQPLLRFLAGEGHQYINEADDQGKTALQYAIARHQLDVVQWLLDHDADTEVKDEDGLTPLHVAALRGHTAVVERLLKHGASMEAKSKSNYTPLHKAAQEGHTAVVERLLDAKADIEAKDQWNYTPLHRAAQEGHTAVVERLLDEKADIEAKDQWNYTPLHRAAQEGHTAVVERLLDEKADKEAKDIHGLTPLHRAAQEGHTAVVERLLKHGASMEAKSKSNYTPLHKAAQEGHTAVVERLLDAKADIEAKDQWNYTPLHRAAQKGRTAVVERLLDHGADKEVKDEDGLTPLHRAVKQGHTATVRLLLDCGASIEAKNNRVSTPLHFAAQEGHKDTAELLLDRGAVIEAKNNSGGTPLHFAVQNGHTAIVERLLDEKADKEAKDIHGLTPLHRAAQNGHTATAELLLDRGAVIDVRCNNGKTPLCVAAELGRTATIASLLDRGANKEAKDRWDYTSLHWAAQEGHTATVALLLGRGANVEAKNNGGKTPLDIAVEKGHEEVATLLRAAQVPGWKPSSPAADRPPVVVEDVTDSASKKDTNDAQRVTPTKQPSAGSALPSNVKDAPALAQAKVALQSALDTHTATQETAEAAAQALREAQAATTQAKHQSQASLTYLKTMEQHVARLADAPPAPRCVAFYLQDTVKEAQDYLHAWAKTDEVVSENQKQQGNRLLAALYAQRQQEQQHYRHADQLFLYDTTLSEYAQAQLLGEVLPQHQYHIDTLSHLIGKLTDTGHDAPQAQKPDLRAPTQLPVVVEDVTDTEEEEDDHEQAQSETDSVYGSAVASVDVDEAFASACASVDTSSDPDVNVASVWSDDPLFHVALDGDLAKDTQASTLAGTPPPLINAEQAVPGEPEVSLDQVGPKEIADTQPQVAQSSQTLTTTKLPKSPFNFFKTLRQVAKAITIPFDNRPLAPLTRAVHTAIIQLNQCPLCTTQLQAPIQRGEKVMWLLEQQRHTPTLDWNERVLCQTLADKLSCHVRLYQRLHAWAQDFTDTDRQAFEAVILPVLKQQFLRANTTIQQEMLTYWENGGPCYTDILQDAAVQDWLSQSLYQDIIQEVWGNNSTLLREQLMREIGRLGQHKQGPALTKFQNQLLWSLRARQQENQWDLSKLCEVTEWLPTDGSQSLYLLNNEAPDWYPAIKANWLLAQLAAFEDRYTPEAITKLCAILVRLPWKKTLTDSFLQAAAAEQDPIAFEHLLHFLEKYPLEDNLLLDTFYTALPEDVGSPCKRWHYTLACGLLREPLTKLFDKEADTLHQQIVAWLPSRLGAYDALHTLLATLQTTEATQQVRAAQALQLQKVFTLLSDYGAATEACVDTFQSIAHQPASQWEATTHQLVVDATFHASHELSTQEIIDRIAQNAQGVFFAGDAQQLQHSYDAIMATYQGPSQVLQQASSQEDEETTQHNAEAQQPIAQWSQETITRWARLVKSQHTPVTQSELLAVVKRAVVLHHGFAPRTTQLLSVLTLLNTPEKMGRLAQINTGEGKSLIVAMSAAMHALKGQKVDVVTTSAELSIPEIKKQAPFFTMLGLTAAENSKKNAADDEARHAIYQKDIVYDTAEDFQADIIQTEFFRKNIRGDRGFGTGPNPCVVLVDEVDSMLFDDRSYSTQLSSLTPAMNHLEVVLGTTWCQINLIASRLRTIDGQCYFIRAKKFQDVPGGVILPEGQTLADCSDLVDDQLAFLKEKTIAHLETILRKLTPEDRKNLAAYKAQEKRVQDLSEKGQQEKQKHEEKQEDLEQEHKEEQEYLKKPYTFLLLVGNALCREAEFIVRQEKGKQHSLCMLDSSDEAAIEEKFNVLRQEALNTLKEQHKEALDALKKEHKEQEEASKATLQAAIEALRKEPWSQEAEYLEIPVHLQDFARTQISNWVESAITALLRYKKTSITM